MEDLKKIGKQIKNDQQLAMDLYATGNADAMYLAGLVANGAKMSRKEHQTWVETAPWYMISEYTVPWVTAEMNSATNWPEWIESKEDHIAASGWCTLAGLLALKSDEEINTDEIEPC